MSLSRASVDRPIATVMFFLAVVLLGIISLRQLAVELFPELDYPRLLIRTTCSDSSPDETVEFITRPIEETVSSLSGVKKITSDSRQGLSIVTLEFYWGTDMDYASLRVREKVDEVRVLFPEGTERPQILRLDPSAQPIMQVAVSGVELSRLTDLCREVVRRRLEQIHGIAFVEVVGGLEPQIEVQFDPDKLFTYGVSAEDITRALRSNNVSFTGGSVKGGRKRHTLRIDGNLQSLSDIRQVAVMHQPQQSPLLLGDIANVFRGTKERRSITRLNGLEAIGILLTKEAGANTVAASGAVRKVLDQLSQEYPEIRFFIVSQQSDFIERSLSNVRSAIIWGALLAFLSLFLFLRSLTYPLIISVSMPVSIIATFIFMHFMGISVNMMSLGGLALGVGILVDNSIVVLENIFRSQEAGKNLVTSSIEGTNEVAMPILAATLTTCAVFLPVAYISGIAGQLFRDLSLTVSFSLFCSLLVSLSLLPVLLGLLRRNRLLGHPGKGSRGKTSEVKCFKYIFDRSEKTLDRIMRLYHSLLRACLDNKAATSGILLLIFVFTLLIAGRLDSRLFPPLETNEVRYHVELSPEVTLYQTAEVVDAIESSLLSVSAVDHVFSRIGALESVLQSGKEEAPYRAELSIRMKNDLKMAPSDLVRHLALKMPEQYEFHGKFESGEMIFRQILGLFRDDLRVDIKGPAWEILVPVADEVSKQLETLRGVHNTTVSHRDGPAQLRISIDREKAALYGITTGQVADMIRQNVEGTVATQIREFDRFVDIVVSPDIVWRDSWQEITSRIISCGDLSLPLKELIEQSVVTAPEELLREDQEFVIHVNASLSGISRKDAAKAINSMITGLETPSDVHVELAGQYLEYQRMASSIRFAFILSLILVYIILAAQFESIRYPFVILLTVPVGLAGGIWMLALTGNSFNVISGIGFVVLAGIVVNDAIIKIDFINNARSRGLPLREAIYEAGKYRFRPIVITSVTTVSGLLPMALSGGTGGELRQPLAVVLIGGISIATLFTLVVIPVFYELISERQISRFDTGAPDRDGDTAVRSDD